jgi:hypothetical protein
VQGKITPDGSTAVGEFNFLFALGVKKLQTKKFVE